MPEIRGRMPADPDPTRMAPCVLCLEPTDVLAEAPGLGELVELPLHIFCAGWLVRAYGQARAGALPDGKRAMLEAYATRAKRLAAGGA